MRWIVSCHPTMSALSATRALRMSRTGFGFYGNSALRFTRLLSAIRDDACRLITPQRLGPSHELAHCINPRVGREINLKSCVPGIQTRNLPADPGIEPGFSDRPYCVSVTSATEAGYFIRLLLRRITLQMILWPIWIVNSRCQKNQRRTVRQIYMCIVQCVLLLLMTITIHFFDILSWLTGS